LITTQLPPASAGEKVLAGDCAVHRARSAGKESEDVRDRGDLVVEHGVVGLAAVLRFELRVLGRFGFDAVRDFQQQGGAILGRRRAPGRKGLRRARHRGVDLFGRGFRDGGDRLAGRGIEDVLLGALTCDQLAVDEQLRVHECLDVTQARSSAGLVRW
jgi:hypothetical protein